MGYQPNEPETNHTVLLLDALPREGRALYENEDHIVDWTGKSHQIMLEIQEQYAFLGGPEEEWIRYLHRPLPAMTWTFYETADVRAVVGVSAVPKKDGVRQRKLIMVCSANYAWSDPRGRRDLGMTAGGALTRLRTSRPLAVAALDESNAFSFVVTPAWM